MDGTLLNEQGQITDENKVALKKACEKGTTIVLTTGRLYGAAKAFNETIEMVGPIISSNGAWIGVPEWV